MTYRLDPEGTETRALHGLVDFGGKDVLEIGSGDGRLTWRYAGRAKSVLAIDPKDDRVATAIEETPPGLESLVTFRAGDFTQMDAFDRAFDVALFSWSL